MILII